MNHIGNAAAVIGHYRLAQIQCHKVLALEYAVEIIITDVAYYTQAGHTINHLIGYLILQRTRLGHRHNQIIIYRSTRIIIGDVLYVDKLPPTCTVKISIHSTLGDAEDGRLVCLGIESVKRKLGRGHSIAGYVVQRSSTPHKGSKLLDIGAKNHFRYGGLLECAVLYLLQCLGKLHFCKG